MLRSESAASPGYQLFMLTLCIYALAALAIQSAISIEQRFEHVLQFADYMVWPSSGNSSSRGQAAGSAASGDNPNPAP